MCTEFDINKLKEKIENLSIDELKDLALKTLIAREKTRLRKIKYYAKKEGVKKS